jgi:alkaline phosphatase
MKKTLRKFVSLCLALVMLAAPIAVYAQDNGAEVPEVQAPKYVFLFIGDGMSFPQVALASFYLGTLEYAPLVRGYYLNFMQFPVLGAMEASDADSFAADSASAATGLATGTKIPARSIGVDAEGNVHPPITAGLIEAGFRVGLATDMQINSATTAPFFAHSEHRDNTYELGLQFMDSGISFFAGTGFSHPTGRGRDMENLYDLLLQAGYTLIEDREEILAIDESYDKVVVAVRDICAFGALPAAIDWGPESITLADFTRIGIDVLMNDEDGFFFMIEHGRLDWSAHANDGATVIHDIIALADAIDVAIDFYRQHPEDTLIIVTGDHETGGLVIGRNELMHDLYLERLSHQSISAFEFGFGIVAERLHGNEDATFEYAMELVAYYFGLILPDNATEEDDPGMILTPAQIDRLLAAFEITMSGIPRSEWTLEDQLIYEEWSEPFAHIASLILNEKAGLTWATHHHSGLPVPVFAMGRGAENFGGWFDNTELHDRLVELLLP